MATFDEALQLAYAQGSVAPSFEPVGVNPDVTWYVHGLGEDSSVSNHYLSSESNTVTLAIAEAETYLSGLSLTKVTDWLINTGDGGATSVWVNLTP